MPQIIPRVRQTMEQGGLTPAPTFLKKDFADKLRRPKCLSLKEIKLVPQYLASLQWHCVGQ